MRSGTNRRDRRDRGDRWDRWQGRPAGAFAIRFLAVALPVVAAVAVAAVTSRLLPRPGTGFESLLWWLTVITASTVTLVVVDREARRLLPLALLLKLTLAFPDRAPSRLKVALRAGTVGDLRKRVTERQRLGLDDEPVRAAAAILVLVGALSRHDRRTRGHSERVRAFTDLIAEEMQLSQDQRDRLRWASLLHDIGKVAIPPQVLNKQGSLNSEEWASITHHPLEGARMAEPLRPWLGEWADAIQQHHERWDGKGYPYGLSGHRISTAARIVTVADAFEVMTASRSYRRPVGASVARNELAACAGTHFDPQVVRAFLNVAIGRLRWVTAPITWLTEIPFLRPLTRGQVAENASAGLVVKTVAALSLAFVVGPAATPAGAGAQAGAGAESAVAGTGVSGGPAGGGRGGGPGGGRDGGGPGNVPAGQDAAKSTPPGLVNKPPTTGNDMVSAKSGQPVMIDVLANDTDEDLDPGSLRLMRQPSHGHASVIGHRVRYQSEQGFTGTDAFQYRVCDRSGDCSVGTIVVNVG